MCYRISTTIRTVLYLAVNLSAQLIMNLSTNYITWLGRQLNLSTFVLTVRNTITYHCNCHSLLLGPNVVDAPKVANGSIAR